MKMIFLLMGLALSGPLAAQQMYRCGNVFQDRPCDADVTEQRISSGIRPRAEPAPAAATQAASTSQFTAQCKRVGEHAQSIMWKREGGATQEKQIGEARGDQGMINLIMAVYAKRGSTPEVRAAIEGECVAERERQAAAAALLSNLSRQANTQPMGPSGTPAAPTAAAASAPAPRPVAAKPADDGRCGNLKSRREHVESRMRAGGSAADMEHWQNQRRDLERQMSEARC